ncbi:hypothetical protein CPB83DRAFT_909178 [Crepidotus variabilis]|uniref:SH3 domain-containing protein n=1 Tax=Crepidotus variabilis TaxID=179855 RepID=A0A9P6JLQ7_9AGAR|nr:hypothetical protein CPB83DRAFT_909178 [Crepidotus variabilis]
MLDGNYNSVTNFYTSTPGPSSNSTSANGRLLAILQKHTPKSNAGSHIGARATSTLSNFHSLIQVLPKPVEGVLKREGDRAQIIASCEPDSEVEGGSREDVVNASSEPEQKNNSNSDVSLFYGASNINFAGPAFFNVYVYGRSDDATSAPLPLSPMVPSIIFIDAIGRQHGIPMSMAISYESFMKSISLLLSGEKMEARMQRGYLQREMVDLCVDQDSTVTLIMGEAEWSVIQPGPGTRLVMRVVLEEKRPRTFSRTDYVCPRPGCGLKNRFTSPSINCQGCEGRFQLSLGASNQIHDTMSEIPSNEIVLIRNFHVKRNITRPEYALAKYNFTDSEGPKETFLAIEEGQIIEILDKASSGWWDGYVNGERGWFPSNYVAAGAASSMEAKDPNHGLPSSHEQLQSDQLRIGTSWPTESAPNPFFEEALSGVNEQHLKQEDDQSPYPPLLTSMLRKVSILLDAVSTDRVSHFESSVADIVSSVRTMLIAAKTLEQTEQILEDYPALAEARRSVVSVLGSLVLQLQKVSVAELYEEERDQETMRMVHLAGQLFSCVRKFYYVARDCGIALPDHHLVHPTATTITAPDARQTSTKITENPTL